MQKMEIRYAKREKRLHHESNDAPARDDRNGEEDRISDLPCHIIGARRENLCSIQTHWKHLWYSYPFLDFRSHSSVLNLFADSSFPRLEKLHLESCKGLKHLRVRMSKLKYLCLESFKILELDISAQKLERLTVIDAPLLESISWKNYVTGEFVIGRCDSLKEATLQFCLGHVGLSHSQLRSFSSFLDGISQCQSLTLDVSVFEILWRCNRLAGVEQCVFDRLTSLEVKLSDANCVKWNEDFSDMIGNMEDDIDWESRARSLKNSFLRRLKVVRITGFKACSNVFEIKANAKVLEELSLEHVFEIKALSEKAEPEIMELPRASPNVRIVFRQPVHWFFAH